MIEGYGNEMKEQQFCNAVQFGMIEVSTCMHVSSSQESIIKTLNRRSVKRPRINWIN